MVGRLVAPDLDVNYWHTSPELIRLDEEASKIATKTKEINVSRSIGMGDSRKLNITDNTKPQQNVSSNDNSSVLQLKSEIHRLRSEMSEKEAEIVSTGKKIRFWKRIVIGSAIVVGVGTLALGVAIIKNK